MHPDPLVVESYERWKQHRLIESTQRHYIATNICILVSPAKACVAGEEKDPNGINKRPSACTSDAFFDRIPTATSQNGIHSYTDMSNLPRILDQLSL